MDRHFSAHVVIDEAMLSELIHEMTDPRPGRADHFRQGGLVNSGKHGLGSTFLAKMSQEQEYPGQSLLAGVKELVDQILFVAYVAGEQVLHEKLRNIELFVEHAHHQR